MWAGSALANNVVVGTMLQAGQGQWSEMGRGSWYAATQDGRILSRHFQLAGGRSQQSQLR